MYGLEYATKNHVIFSMMTNNNTITREDLRNVIVSLNLPSIILELYDGKCKDEIVLKYAIYNYGYPAKILDLNKDQQKHYLTERYCPILCYLEDTIFAYDQISKGYVTYSIEYFEDKSESLTWDGLFINEVLRWWENEIEDEDILYIGNLFGLKYTKEIISDIYTTSEMSKLSSFQDIFLWRNKLLDKINGRAESN